MERELIGLCKADLLSLRAKLQQYIGQLYSDAHPANLNQYIQQALSEITPSTAVFANHPPSSNNDVSFTETSGQPETSSIPVSIYEENTYSPTPVAQPDGMAVKQEESSFHEPTALPIEPQQVESAISAVSFSEFGVDPVEALPISSAYALETDHESPSCSHENTGRPPQQQRRRLTRRPIQPVKHHVVETSSSARQISQRSSVDATATALANRAHSSTMNGVMRWHCPVQGCEKVFTGNYGKKVLGQHIRVIHTCSAKQYNCPHCPYRTPIASNMSRHQRQRHNYRQSLRAGV